ncbi:MAG: radical SAM protein [Planctomycetota bacterium]
MATPTISETEHAVLVKRPRTVQDVVRLCDPSIKIPDKHRMYRFPWSLNDNPVGWVEITDKCNIRCTGCYRLRLEGHKPLEEIKEEIRFLKKWRNVDVVYLAGGEPLIHPDVVEIVRFIKQLRIKATSLTNGEALDKNLLRELKKAGLMELSFHIDSGQTRKGWTGKSEEDLNELRQHFADMLWKEKVKCNYNMTISVDNFHLVPKLVQWSLNNRGKVQGFTFLVLRGASHPDADYSVDGKPIERDSNKVGLVTNVDSENFKIKSTDVYRYIKTHFPEYNVSAYLGGTETHDAFKWLIGLTICSGNEMIGSTGAKTVELAQTLHHLFKGTYTSGSKRNFGRSVFWLAPFDRSVRKALKRYLLRPLAYFRRVYGFTISIIQPGDLLPDGRIDMCDSCPDMTYYKGRLVNSCRLEEYRLYGKFVTIKPHEDYDYRENSSLADQAPPDGLE